MISLSSTFLSREVLRAGLTGLGVSLLMSSKLDIRLVCILKEFVKTLVCFLVPFSPIFCSHKILITNALHVLPN